ncbi:UNC93-like protein [Styela clava]
MELRSIRNQFLGCLSGMFLSGSAYISMLNLQSSINIEDGLGTIASSVSYGTSTVFLIFFTTILMRKFGIKICLIASEITYMFYVLANLYPTFYTLIPAAILVGAGEAMLWPCMSIISYHFAMEYAKKRKNELKEDAFYVNLYSGYFFTNAQCCQIFGNLITYAVMYGFKDYSDQSAEDAVDNNSTTISWISTTSDNFNKYEYCGANDCQDVDTVGESLEQYVPSDNLTLIILISILTVMCITSLIIHLHFVPNSIIASGQEDKDFSDYVNNSFKSEEEQNTYIDGTSDTVKINTNNSLSFSGKRNIRKASYSSEISQEYMESNRKLQKEENGLLRQYYKMLKDLGTQLLRQQQLLIIPITFYVGLTQAYVFSELTRAFSSCVVGVSMVGIHMATYGLSDAILSYIIAKYGQKLGRNIFFVVSTVLSTLGYLYCLLWNPSPGSAWSVFLIYVAFGISDGVWQTLLIGK